MLRSSFSQLLLPLGVLLALMLSLVSIALSIQPPRIASFDMKATLQLFSKQFAAQELSDDERQKVIARFSRAMEAGADEYSNDHRMVVLVSPAVVEGAVDATPVIQEAIKARLQQGGAARD